MYPTFRTSAALPALILMLGFAASAGAGQTDSVSDPAGVHWSRWQGRLSLGLTTPTGRSDFLATDVSGLKVGSLSLLGDYYFSDPLRIGSHTGGFRATSGLIVGLRSTLGTGQASLTSSRGVLGMERRLLSSLSSPQLLPDTGADTTAVPYLGVGYTGLSLQSRWSFSADFGMVARSPGNAVKLGRVFTGSQGVDDLLRDLRLAPVLQLGVSYSF
jgi:hypothetical protein